MKLILIIPIVLILFSCNPQKEALSIPPSNMKMIPDIGDNTTIPIDNNGKETLGVVEILPHIPISSDYRVVLINEANLDKDMEDEQIIITQSIKENQDILPSLEIWIADFRGNRNDYVLSWRAPLGAVNPETLSLSFKDITGSLHDELLILGFTHENHQTLDIFYSEGDVYKYKSILSLKAKGSIELQLPNSQSNTGNNNLSKEVVINVSEEDPSSENPLDILLSRWKLNQNSHLFYLAEKSKIAENEMLLEEIRKILQGNEMTFLNHLQGFWYKEGNHLNSEELPLIFVNPQEESIFFLMDDELESYEIQYYHKGIYSKMYMRSINSNIRNTTRNITVTLNNLNNISLLVEDNNDKTAVQSMWTGQYKRMDGELLSDLVPQIFEPLHMNDYPIRGKYRSSTGEEIDFMTPPHFNYLSEEGQRQGSYALLLWEEKTLLELDFYSRRGSLEEQKYYQLEQFTETTEDYIVRSIILTPGWFTIGGFHPSGEKNRGFEQLEIKDSEN